MWVYEVTLNVDSSSIDDFLAWLPGHMQRVMDAGKFVRSSLVLEKEQPTKVQVLYYCDRKQIIDEYIAIYATALREEAIRLFGDHVVAHREIYKI